MKLKNKKTGEIVENYPDRFVINSGEQIRQYDSLAELNAEWEDYDEPKEYYFIRDDGSGIGYSPIGNSIYAKRRDAIGNYFETKEEAENAVEKIKAWKRLKDKGFRFTGFNACSVDYDIGEQYRKYISQDLDLLFGGEE